MWHLHKAYRVCIYRWYGWLSFVWLQFGLPMFTGVLVLRVLWIPVVWQAIISLARSIRRTGIFYQNVTGAHATYGWTDGRTTICDVIDCMGVDGDASFHHSTSYSLCANDRRRRCSQRLQHERNLDNRADNLRGTDDFYTLSYLLPMYSLNRIECLSCRIVEFWQIIHSPRRGVSREWDLNSWRNLRQTD